MAQFSYLRAIPYSFFSTALYRDVAQRWQGLGLAYLLLLTLLASLLISTQLTYYMERGLNAEDGEHQRISQKMVESMIHNLPPFTLRDGELFTNVEQPYFTRTPEGKLVTVIDTTGKIRSLSETDALFLFTAHEIMYRRQGDSYQVMPYTQLKLEGQEVTKDTLRRWATDFYAWMDSHGWWVFALIWLLLTGFLTVFSFIIRLFVVLIAALLMRLVAKIGRAGLRYEACARLSCVAITPVEIVLLAESFLGVSLSSLVLFIVWVVTLAFALWSNWREPAYSA